MLLVLVSCKTETEKEIIPDVEDPKFSWLIGQWQRIDDEPGRKTFENWSLNDIGHYTGYGYTLQENDTVFEEQLAIKPENKTSKSADNSWILEVTGVNQSPTIFKVEQWDMDSFTAVNLDNEFPTHIKYAISKDTLNALVSNEEMNIEFTFIKQ